MEIFMPFISLLASVFVFAIGCVGNYVTNITLKQREYNKAPDTYPDTYPVKKPLPVIFVALPLALLILVASVAMLIRYVIFYLDRAFQ